MTRVAVLLGGRSAEREVSLSSGRECAAALREGGFDVIEIDAGQGAPEELAERLVSSRAEVAFNALHGRWGEDGVVQGLLEWIELPYTHSGVLASSLAMNKARSKEIFAAAGLNVARHQLETPERIAASHVMDPPYVVKPINEGSSVGVLIVPEGANRPPALDDLRAAAGVRDLLMVEEYIAGRELTVSVLGDRPLVVTEIFSSGWYDYHAKYASGGSRHTLPADLPPEVAEAALETALAAHNALGCRGMSRSDFRYDDNRHRGSESLKILETNTQPGMTPTSLAPEQAAFVGMSFVELTRWLVEDASLGR